MAISMVLQNRSQRQVWRKRNKRAAQCGPEQSRNIHGIHSSKGGLLKINGIWTVGRNLGRGKNLKKFFNRGRGMHVAIFGVPT